MKKNKGMTLILTLLLLTTLAAITFAFLEMIIFQTKKGGGEISSAQALWLAEAGFEQTLYQLKNDSVFRNNPTTVTGSLGDGNYSVVVTKNGSTYTLASTGTIGTLNRKLQKSALVLTDVPEAFNYQMHSGINIDFNNTTGTLTGNLSATGEIQNEASLTINGSVTESSTVANPTVNYSSYESIADHTESTDKTFAPNQTYSGIWYVNGNVTIERNVTINGSIIATGNITITSNVNNVVLNPAAPYPALVAKLKITGNTLRNSTFNGLIFAEEEITFNNNQNNRFNGSIISYKNVNIKDGTSLTFSYDDTLQTNPPPYFAGEGTGVVIITKQKDWEEIFP